MQSDKVSKSDKTIIIGALGYLISPIDVVPDAVPIAGLADDLSVLLFVLKKVWVNVDKYANTSAASIPIALCEAQAAGALKKGDNVLLVGFGAGLTWAAIVLKWSK